MRFFTDQIGNNVKVPDDLRRIVSLVPSQSEFIWELGVQDILVGITRFCIHPAEMFQRVTRVGGTKKLNLQKIRDLRPDIIIGNKEENDREQIERLQEEFPVWMSDIVNLQDAYGMMYAIGNLLKQEIKAASIINGIQHSLTEVKGRFTGLKVAYLIWHSPTMLAGRNTFINCMLEHLGFINVAAGIQRYPAVIADELAEMDPDLLLLSSEPFPFSEKHQRLYAELFPSVKSVLVNGEMFSWYGSRLLRVPGYINSLEHQLGTEG